MKLTNKNTFLNTYKNLKVLVTGSTGFKGAWLSYWLNNLGAKVTGVSLKPEKDSILFKSLKLYDLIDQNILDVRNFNKLNSLIKITKPDIIFHLAAQSIVSKSFDEPLNTIETNVLGSANILEIFRVNKIPSLVFITSDKCYLNLGSKKNFKETDVLGGLDNYSSSKASAEIIFSSYYNSYFKNKKYLNLASARAGNVIGGGDMKKNRIVPDIIKSLHLKKKLYLRNPKSTRPWQHVLEPLSAYLLLGHSLLNKKISSNLIPSWNFGPKISNCKNVEYIKKLVLKNWGQSNINVIKSKNNLYHESKFLSLDITKAKDELNWKPRLNLEDTIKLTVQWYKNYFDFKKVDKFTQDQIQFFLNK